MTVCCVVGFPLGAMSTRAKAEEAKEAAANGAKEVDMVINVGAIKSGDWKYVRNDIAKVVGSASAGGAIVKVILETCLLTDEEKVRACQVSKEAGAAFVKTSTGFSTGGATAGDVKLMRDTVGPSGITTTPSRWSGRALPESARATELKSSGARPLPIPGIR